MWEVYFPWPITEEIFMSDFQRFFILENVEKIKNVKKRKNVFFTSMAHTALAWRRTR